MAAPALAPPIASAQDRKATKAEAGYVHPWWDEGSSCRACRFREGEQGCAMVGGMIEDEGRCRFYGHRRAAGKPTDTDQGDAPGTVGRLKAVLASTPNGSRRAVKEGTEARMTDAAKRILQDVLEGAMTEAQQLALFGGMSGRDPYNRDEAGRFSPKGGAGAGAGSSGPSAEDWQKTYSGASDKQLSDRHNQLMQMKASLGAGNPASAELDKEIKGVLTVAASRGAKKDGPPATTYPKGFKEKTFTDKYSPSANVTVGVKKGENGELLIHNGREQIGTVERRESFSRVTPSGSRISSHSVADPPWVATLSPSLAAEARASGEYSRGLGSTSSRYRTQSSAVQSLASRAQGMRRAIDAAKAAAPKKEEVTPTSSRLMQEALDEAGKGGGSGQARDDIGRFASTSGGGAPKALTSEDSAKMHRLINPATPENPNAANHWSVGHPSKRTGEVGIQPTRSSTSGAYPVIADQQAAIAKLNAAGYEAKKSGSSIVVRPAGSRDAALAAAVKPPMTPAQKAEMSKRIDQTVERSNSQNDYKKAAPKDAESKGWGKTVAGESKNAYDHERKVAAIAKSSAGSNALQQERQPSAKVNGRTVDVHLPAPPGSFVGSKVHQANVLSIHQALDAGGYAVRKVDVSRLQVVGEKK